MHFSRLPTSAVQSNVSCYTDKPFTVTFNEYGINRGTYTAKEISSYISRRRTFKNIGSTPRDSTTQANINIIWLLDVGYTIQSERHNILILKYSWGKKCNCHCVTSIFRAATATLCNVQPWFDWSWHRQKVSAERRTDERENVDQSEVEGLNITGSLCACNLSITCILVNLHLSVQLCVMKASWTDG